jgi:hypothetical protein
VAGEAGAPGDRSSSLGWNSIAKLATTRHLLVRLYWMLRRRKHRWLRESRSGLAPFSGWAQWQAAIWIRGPFTAESPR